MRTHRFKTRVVPQNVSFLSKNGEKTTWNTNKKCVEKQDWSITHSLLLLSMFSEKEKKRERNEQKLMNRKETKRMEKKYQKKKIEKSQRVKTNVPLPCYNLDCSCCDGKFSKMWSMCCVYFIFLLSFQKKKHIHTHTSNAFTVNYGGFEVPGGTGGYRIFREFCVMSLGKKRRRQQQQQQKNTHTTNRKFIVHNWTHAWQSSLLVYMINLNSICHILANTSRFLAHSIYPQIHTH